MQIRSSRKSPSVLSCAFVAFLFLFASANRLQAQTQTGTISGTATDTSGAALVGATVIVTNEGTNVSQTTTTDGEGRYNVAQLPIGNYDLQASLTGFQTVIHKGVTLTVGAQPLVDFSLPVGQATQTVTVESQVSQVETQTAAVSTLVSEQQVSQLPLNGRNYTQLLELAPGVQVVNNGAGGGGVGSSFYGAQVNYSVSGSRPEGQGFLIDNEDVRDFWEHGPGSAALGTTLGIEGMQEFQVLTNTYSSQFGGAGAVLNAASKSGTNALHGSVYEYLRNSALDSRNFFDFKNQGCFSGATRVACGTPGSVPVVTKNKKPEFRQNQFGGSAGGPIEKDRLFFFANYEGFRNALGRTISTFVPEPYVVGDGTTGQLPCLYYANNFLPTPAACVGNPSSTSILIPQPLGSYDAASGQQSVAAQHIAGILNLYPAPTGSDLGGYGAYSAPGSFNNVQNENYVLGRVDYNISAKDSIFGRYVSDRANQAIPLAGSIVVPYWPELDNSANQYFTLQERRIVSPTVVNQVRFNFTRTFEKAVTGPAPAGAPSTLNTANDPLFFFAGFPDGNTTAGCPGCGGLGANTALPYDIAQNKYGGSDDLVWTHGSHSFKVGIAVTRVLSNISAPFVFGGSFAFFSEQSFLQGAVGGFLGTYAGHGNSARNFKETDYALYFEDDWKVTTKLTLNLGIRYDFATNPIGDVAGGGGRLNALVNPPLPDQNAYFTDTLGHTYGNGYTPVHHLFASNPNAQNFEPRLGIAWDPFANHKTSIRSGFGLFHDQIAPRLYASNYYLNPPYASTVTFPAVPFQFPNPFPGVVPGGATPPISEFAGVLYNTSSSPYFMQYNLTIQRQITSGTVLSVGYVGSQGRHLFTEVDLNPPKCATFPNCSTLPTATNPGPNFAGQPRINSTINPASGQAYFGSLSTSVAQQTSNYNSLQASLNHQFSHSFTGQVSYTYSKCLTTGSVSSGLEQGIYEQADPYNRKYDYGRCSFDIKHNLVANGLYSLPFKGNRLVSGWQFTSILRVSTGLPVTIQEGGGPFDIARLGAIQGDRPNYSGTCPGGRDQVLGKWYAWFNPLCYAVQPVGTLGTVPRSSVTGPGLVNLDSSIIKNTKLWERVNTEFRAEFFNVLNHTNLGQPASYGLLGFGGTTPPFAPYGGVGLSGASTATATTQREIQFALKFIF